MAVSTTVQVVMPQMGDSVTEGTILEWHKQEGDAVAVDETIVEISTDKVDAEVPAPAAGTIGEILAAEGATVTVGQVIARMTTGGAAPAAASPPADAPAAAEPAPGGGTVDETGSASPVARRVAAAKGVDLGGVSGSARGGRI